MTLSLVKNDCGEIFGCLPHSKNSLIILAPRNLRTFLVCKKRPALQPACDNAYRLELILYRPAKSLWITWKRHGDTNC